MRFISVAQLFEQELAQLSTDSSPSTSISLCCLSMLWHSFHTDTVILSNLEKNGEQYNMIGYVLRLKEIFNALASSQATALPLSSYPPLFSLSFHPHIKQVRPLPFFELSSAEQQLLDTYQTRLQGVHENEKHPTLLGTLWGLVQLYLEYRHQSDSSSSAPSPSTNANNSTSNSKASFDKGCERIKQIEAIYDDILHNYADQSALPPSSPSLLSPPSISMSMLSLQSNNNTNANNIKDKNIAPAAYNAAAYLSSIDYSRIGWFYLHFGHLQQSEHYFQKEFEWRSRQMEMERQMETENRSETVSGTDTDKDSQLVQRTSSTPLLLAKSLEFLGIIHRELGSLQSSVDALQQAYQQMKKLYDEENVQLIGILCNLGNTYGVLGQPSDKKQSLERALHISEANYGTAHPSLISILTNLSACYEDIEQRKACLLRAHDLAETLYGSAHIQLASILSRLGQVEGEMGHAEKKIELLTRASQLLLKQYGDMHPELGIIYTNLGMAYASINADTGLQYLQKALAIKAKHYGNMHREVAITLCNMGSLYGSMGNVSMELRSFQQAYKIFATITQNALSRSHSAMAAASGQESAAGLQRQDSAGSQPTPPLSSPHHDSSMQFCQQRLLHCQQKMQLLQRLCIEQSICTFQATDTTRTTQTWYRCVTCSPQDPNVGCCVSCSSLCHADHELIIGANSPSSFFCDCGQGVLKNKCQALKQIDLSAQAQSTNNATQTA